MWIIPVHDDDRQMFEHLTMECLQCGLRWELLMVKRGFTFIVPIRRQGSECEGF